MTDTATPTKIPFVEYLVLDGDRPHLVANECSSCEARFFDRRNACAACFATDFRQVDVATDGRLRSYTIVALAAAGVDVPFVAGVVDCRGMSVRANIVNCPPDPKHVQLGMKVRLVTYSMGADSAGTEAINFGFEPAG
jgi:uncharacterized protein